MIESVSLIIHNAIVVTVDGEHRVIDRDGAVAVNDNRIVAVGSNEEVLAQYTADQMIDAKGKVLMPGLVDLHAHSALTRGLADDLELGPFLATAYTEIMLMEESDFNEAARITYLEAIKSGTTCINEMAVASVTESKVKIAEKMGIRTTITGSWMMEEDHVPETLGSGDAKIEAAIYAMEKFNGAADDRVRIAFGIEGVCCISPEHLRTIKELSDKYNAPVHVHVNETDDDRELARKRHGGRDSVTVLYEEGLLNERCIAAHCVQMRDDEIEMFVKTGAHISHNPLSNSKCGMGVAPVPKMLERGINIGIGHDMSFCSNSRDIFEAMKFTAALHKAHNRDASVMPAQTVLEMATINGARALGLEDDIGSIEVGKKADMLLINLRIPALVPTLTSVTFNNVVSNLVYSMQSEAVDTVIIDGKLVMQGRRLLTDDEDEIMADADRRARDMVARMEQKFAS